MSDEQQLLNGGAAPCRSCAAASEQPSRVVAGRAPTAALATSVDSTGAACSARDSNSPCTSCSCSFHLSCRRVPHVDPSTIDVASARSTVQQLLQHQDWQEQPKSQQQQGNTARVLPEVCVASDVFDTAADGVGDDDHHGFGGDRGGPSHAQGVGAEFLRRAPHTSGLAAPLDGLSHGRRRSPTPDGESLFLDSSSTPWLSSEVAEEPRHTPIDSVTWQASSVPKSDLGMTHGAPSVPDPLLAGPHRTNGFRYSPDRHRIDHVEFSRVCIANPSAAAVRNAQMLGESEGNEL